MDVSSTSSVSTTHLPTRPGPSTGNAFIRSPPGQSRSYHRFSLHSLADSTQIHQNVDMPLELHSLHVKLLIG